MQPRKYFRYPSPPPSLIIKPSATNSPSHSNLAKDPASSASSTPERMKVGQSLASHMYLGDFNIPSAKDIDGMENVDEDMLLISIQQNSPNRHALHRSNTGIELTDTSSESNNRNMTQSLDEKMLTNLLQRDDKPQTTGEAHTETRGDINTIISGLLQKTDRPIEKFNGKNIHEEADKLETRDSHDHSSPSTPKANGHMTINKQKELKQQTETAQQKKSNLRNNFFQNYDDHLQKVRSNGIVVKKVKKRVSFKLPSMERDISDMSISSNLSAADDYSGFHYDDDSDICDDFLLEDSMTKA